MKITSEVSQRYKTSTISQLIVIYAFTYNPWTTFPYTFIIIIMAILAIVFSQDKSLQTLGLSSKFSLSKTIFTAIILFTIIEPVFDFIIQPIIVKVTHSTVDYSAFNSLFNNFPKFLKYLTFVTISAGIGEEILFRGFTFRQLKAVIPESKLQNTILVAISATIFSLPHAYQGVSGLLTTFLFGVMFAIIYIKSNYNLWIPIIVHTLTDSLFLFLAYKGRLDFYTLANEHFFGY